MTITSDRVYPLVDELDTDLLPGSTDVQWAERAYRYQPTPPDDHHSARRAHPRRQLRILAAAVALSLAMAGLVVVLLTTKGSSAPPTSSPAVNRPAVTVPGTHVASGYATLTPPLLRPEPFTFPIFTAPRR